MTAARGAITSDDLFVAGAVPQVRLHLRLKRRMSRGRVRGNRRAVVFVHGATYCAVSAYDAPLPGGSWLDYAAARGRDAYAVSVRGYGRSSAAGLPSHHPPGGGPCARTSEAVDDLAAAVRFVREHAGVDRVDLVGWSWGTAICAGFAAREPDVVGRLALYAPLWIVRDPAGMAIMPRPLPMLWLPQFGPLLSAGLRPYRSVSLDEVRRRWFRGLDDRTAEALCPPEQLALWWRHTLACGVGDQATTLRAPNGVLADVLEYWACGIPTYDPARITAPALLVVGEWDRDTPPAMAQELYGRLRSSVGKRLEVLARGTHAMSLEAGRFELYERVQRFLDEPAGSAT